MSQTPMGFKISAVLQESLCRLGSKLTFREASEEIGSENLICVLGLKGFGMLGKSSN